MTNIFPQEGYYEQDPIEILQVVEECIEKTVEKLVELGGSPKDIGNEFHVSFDKIVDYLCIFSCDWHN